jgi:hypothetical protein
MAQCAGNNQPYVRIQLMAMSHDTGSRHEEHLFLCSPPEARDSLSFLAAGRSSCFPFVAIAL